MSLEYEGSTIETDENGYLVSLDDWSEGVADKLALDEDIEMNDQHWDIINFLRDYYQEYQINLTFLHLLHLVYLYPKMSLILPQRYCQFQFDLKFL